MYENEYPRLNWRLFGCWASVSLLLFTGALRKDAVVLQSCDASKVVSGGQLALTFMSLDFVAFGLYPVQKTGDAHLLCYQTKIYNKA